MKGWIWLSAVVALVWIATDWQQRFGQAERGQGLSSDPVSLEHTFDATMSASLAGELQERYKKYQEGEQTESDAIDDPMLDAERQAQQQGRLTEVYSGENKISLVAVITEKGNDNKQILLSVTYIPDSITRTEAVRDGDSIYGYRVQIVNSTQVDLYRQDSEENSTNTQSADISLVMYRKS